MRKPFRERSAASLAHVGPNMTPMVDVVMVILIFFMLSASLMGPEWLLRVALPRPQAAVASSDVVPVSVRLVLQQGEVRVRMRVGAEGAGAGVECSAEEFGVRIRTAADEHSAKQLAVALSAEDGVPYEAVVRAHERCVGVGVKRIALPGAN